MGKYIRFFFVAQARRNGGQARVVAVEKRSDSGYILKVEPIKIADELI